MNTYIAIDTMVYSDSSRNTGHIYTHVKSSNLKLHLDVPYEQAKAEMARLMLRTGKRPDVIGKDDNTDCTMYIINAFLD